MCLLAAVVTAVAGCVGMPSNGPAVQATANPPSPAPDVNFIGPHPSGPQAGGDPSTIVQEFLLASASYPTYPVAKQYLVAKAAKTWDPGWAVTEFSNLNVPKGVAVTTGGHSTGEQVTVKVAGTVQASFDGSGPYVSAQSPGQAANEYPFDLVKVGGQWRITNPPDTRMLTNGDFPLFYKAQDLYFVDPQDDSLVPDSVFVPLGPTVSDLLDNLVTALVQGPKTPWLQGAADTELPQNTTVLGVTLAGSAVTVNLGGPAARATDKQRGLFSAQLLWTLTSSFVGSPGVQSVVLEINGRPWTPSGLPVCSGARSASPVQTIDAYQCVNPYPSSPAGFYYVNGEQSWVRCGAESQALHGLIGPVVPVVGRAGTFSGQPCVTGQYVHEGSTVSPSPQAQSLPPSSMVSVSPDGKYLAVVSAANGDVYVGTLQGQVASFPAKPRLLGGGVTALSWDGNDDLWVAQAGTIMMLPLTAKKAVQIDFSASVTDLSIAPDGVRIAFIGQNAGLDPALYLAAIGGGQPSTGGLGPPHLSIREVASIGPNLQRPASLAWYDADDLVVLDDVAGGNTLWDVPVDGQQAQELPVTPSGVTSITADGSANVLVAGLSGNSLAVSTSLDGPWYQLGEPGQNPAYPG